MFNVFHLQGVDALHDGEYQHAKTCLLQAIAENPETPESYFFLGKACFLCDEKDEAILYLKQYIELRKDNAEEIGNISYAFDLLGQSYEAINKDDDAIVCYQAATKIHPSCASAWHNMGLLYIKSAQHYLEQEKLEVSRDLFNTAKFFIKKALEISGDNPMFLNSVASWYETYIELLEKLMEDQEAVHKNIANNFQWAIQYYQQALTRCDEKDVTLKNIITSNLTECFAQYGHFLYKNQNYVAAQAFYLETLQLTPSHLSAITQMGMCLFQQDDYVEARKYFLKIFDETDDQQEIADAWLNIACTYRLEKDWDNARDALDKAKRLAPEDPCIDEEEQKLTDSIDESSLMAAPRHG
ncbi:MAG: tetratricopeptide repeat protein [Legionellaceae bacterium]